MDLPKLSDQFQTAVGTINESRKSNRSDEASGFDIKTCVMEYAAKFSRLQELKNAWTKLEADDEFLEVVSQDWDLVINRTRGVASLDFNAGSKIVTPAKRSQK